MPPPIKYVDAHRAARRSTSPPSSVPDALEIAVRRHCEQQLALDVLIDDEATVTFQKGVEGGFRPVALAPRTIAEELVRKIVDRGVHHHEIASLRHERRIELEFLEHVIVGVVRVEDEHYHAG